MDQYARNFRPLLVFAADDAAADFGRQRAMLDAVREGIGERDMVLIEIVGDRVRTPVGPSCEKDADSLRQEFDVDPDASAVLLLGKDTGVKLRSNEPVSADELFALIDAMPMRMQEMKARR